MVNGPNPIVHQHLDHTGYRNQTNDAPPTQSTSINMIKNGSAPDLSASKGKRNAVTPYSLEDAFSDHEAENNTHFNENENQ